MPTWPATLPQAPLVEGYSEAAPELIARSQTAVGWAKTRRRATAGPARITAAYRMSGDQLDDFDTFVDADLANRTLAFDWPHPRTGTTVSVRIVTVPVVVPAGGADRWTVSLTLETMPWF